MFLLFSFVKILYSFVTISFVLASSIGMKRQITARVDPVTAIQTTLTAAGTRTKYSGKWSDASRNPNAEDFIAVSIAVVRAIISLKPIALHRKLHTIRTIEARASCTGVCHFHKSICHMADGALHMYHTRHSHASRRTLQTRRTIEAGATTYMHRQ